MTKITIEILENLGFILVPNLIQSSYMLILKDESELVGPIFGDSYYDFKALSVAVCNDKGLGEYYLFIRDGSTANRAEDEVICLTRNLLYEEDLKKFIRLINL